MPKEFVAVFSILKRVEITTGSHRPF